MNLLDKIEVYLDTISRHQLDKGQRILNSSGKQIKIKEKTDGYTLQIPSESRKSVYPVIVFDDDQFDELLIMCECLAYVENDDCKHCAAGAIVLQDYLLEARLQPNKQTADASVRDTDGAGYFQFEMNYIDWYTLQQLSGVNPNLLYKIVGNLTPGPQGMPYQQFAYYEKGKRVCDVDILFDGVDGFKTKGSCRDSKHPLCKHIAAGFFYLEYHYNRFYFNRFVSRKMKTLKFFLFR